MKNLHLSMAKFAKVRWVLALPLLLLGCADATVPGARNANIPAPALAEPRPEAINERPDSVVYLPLGSDVLVPEADTGAGLPKEIVGPFELRSETLAGALQLILADYEIPLAFETEEGLSRTITVANLKGPLDNVVDRVCSLADLYCSYEEGLLVIKNTQTFTVTVPPVGQDTGLLNSLAGGLAAIIGSDPITEPGTRTIIYEATNRTAKLAERYFQRLRSNTALIVFEVYIWEVGLNSDNATGIDWEQINRIGKFETGITIPGGVPGGFTPVSIGLPTLNGSTSFDGNDVFEFISNYGAVKTISQPQITVLSGSAATLRAADTQNYVSSFTRTIDNGEVAVSTEVDSVDTGFTMTISSTWDRATIYANIEIELQEVIDIEPFTSGAGTASEVSLGLPITTEREVATQVRIRPGDSLLIAGLVRENDDVNESGPGFSGPLIPTSRSAAVENTEVVFLLRPRVIVYTAEGSKNISAAQTGVNSYYDLSPSGAGSQMPSEPLPSSTIGVDALNPGL